LTNSQLSIIILSASKYKKLYSPDEIESRKLEFVIVITPEKLWKTMKLDA
jgi:hypothetical protein